MMDFVLLTLSFTMGSLLSGVIALFVITRPIVMKHYMKWVMKTSTSMVEQMFDTDEDED